MNSIPEHWEMVNFYDILDYLGGTQPPKKVFVYQPKQEYVRLLQIRDFGENPFPTYIPFSKQLHIANEDDLLLARYGGDKSDDCLGRVCTGLSGAYNVALVKLLINENRVLKHFVKYLFGGSFFREVVSKNSRSCQKGFNKEDLKEVFFPLPPINEQQQIVEKLDAILPKVRQLKARLEKIPVLLNKFRQSVLSYACSGKLTEDWRVSNSSTANWDLKELSEIAEAIFTGPFGTMLHKSDYIQGGIPVVNPTNIINNLIVPDCKVTVTADKASELARYILKEKDLVLSRRGDLSKCGIVSEKEAGWLAGTGTFIVRVKMNPNFFRMAFQTPATQETINSASIGSTMPNLNQGILRKLQVPCPRLEEQQVIVTRVDKLFALADSLEIKYKQAMQSIDKIEQSVLAKAFRGELHSIQRISI